MYKHLCKGIPRFKIMGGKDIHFRKIDRYCQKCLPCRLNYFTLPPAMYECQFLFYIYFCSLFLEFRYVYCHCCIFNIKKVAFSFFSLLWLLGFEQAHMKIEKFPV